MYISLIEINNQKQIILETQEDTEANRISLHKKRLKAIKEGKDVDFVCTANRPEAVTVPRKRKRTQERALINLFERKNK